MFKLLLFAASASFLLGIPTCKVADVVSDSKPITHELFDAELKRFVTADGWVDYTAWQKDTTQLQAYLALVAKHHPNDEHWSKDEQLAYWINAYNAYTVQLMLRHWPVESIKEISSGIGFINSTWDLKFITIEGQVYDLNNLEHGIIRPKFEDPRIHMAVNCASVSCPRLRAEAFVAERLNEQLDEQAEKFLASFRNDLTDLANPQLSSIFKWYGSDFKWQEGSLRSFVEQYGKVALPADADFSYLEYNWSTNDISNRKQ